MYVSIKIYKNIGSKNYLAKTISYKFLFSTLNSRKKTAFMSPFTNSLDKCDVMVHYLRDIRVIFVSSIFHS